MTVTHRLVASHFSVTPRDGHSSEYRTRTNRSLGRNVAFSSKHVLYQRSDSSTHSDVAETPVGSGAAGSKLRQSSSIYRSIRRPGPRRQTQVHVTLAALAKHSAPQAGRWNSASLHAPSLCSFCRNSSRSADRIFMKSDTEDCHKNL